MKTNINKWEEKNEQDKIKKHIWNLLCTTYGAWCSRSVSSNLKEIQNEH